MASTFTSNLYLEEPANGDYVGSWDVPVNANLSAIDLAVGQSVSVNLAAGSVTLATSQVRSTTLIFTGALIGNVAVTVPTISGGANISGRYWNVVNSCDNSSSFVVTMASTLGSVIGIPPFESVGVLLEGTGGTIPGTMRHCGLGRVGSYWDYAGSSIPGWLSACSLPPYLYCNGTAFSSALYPALSIALNGTTLPDARGRYRASLNDGTNRVTAGPFTGGVDGNTILAAGGNQVTTLSSQNVPLVDTVVNDPGHIHTGTAPFTGGTQTGAGSNPQNLVGGGPTAITINSHVTGITVDAGRASPVNFSILPPTYIGGLTFVRAA